VERDTHGSGAERKVGGGRADFACRGQRRTKWGQPTDCFKFLKGILSLSHNNGNLIISFQKTCCTHGPNGGGTKEVAYIKASRQAVRRKLTRASRKIEEKRDLKKEGRDGNKEKNKTATSQGSLSRQFSPWNVKTQHKGKVQGERLEDGQGTNWGMRSR